MPFLLSPGLVVAPKKKPLGDGFGAVAPPTASSPSSTNPTVNTPVATKLGAAPLSTPSATPTPQRVAASPAPPQGTRIGNLTLLPGTGLDTAVKAVQKFKTDYNAAYHPNPTGLKIIAPDNPTSMSAFTPPSANVAPTHPGPVAPPITSGVQAPGASSVSMLPGTNIPAISPANAAGSPASYGSGAPPTGGVAAPSPGAQVLGQFNGRNITQADSDRLSAKLPSAPGPVALGPNGSYAFATGSNATPLSTPTSTPPAPQQVVAPQTNIDTYAMRDADKAREAELGRLNGTIDRLGFGPSALNSPGERQLYAALTGQRNDLVRQQIEAAGGDVASQRTAAASRDNTAAEQTGASARNTASIAGDMDRTLLGEAGDTARALIQPPTYEKASDGTLLNITGNSANNVTGPDGTTPVRLAPPGAITDTEQLSYIGSQAAAIQRSIAELRALGQSTGALDAQLAQYQKLADGLLGVQQSKTSTPPAVTDNAIATLRANPDLAPAFDQKYGKGLAARYLGGHQ